MLEHKNDGADVLIVGAGPVGMSLALELGLRGIKVRLVERDPARGPQPRAKTLNMRSLAHLRRWGIADTVRNASTLTDHLPTDIIFRTRLFGHHIATLPNIYFRGNSQAGDPRFNEPSEWIPQFEVERVMKGRIDELETVTVQFDTELVDLTQDATGVTALLRHDGQDLTIRARYVVGTDGARSRVRDVIGAKMTGRYAFGANFNMMIDVPELESHPPHPRGIMHWIINADSPAIMGPIGDLWYIGKRLPPGVESMSPAEIRDFITATIGHPVEFAIKSIDPWYSHELISDKYRDGRIFLAGDACHLHPPFGGYGMNMGIADAVDIGWKLAAVLKGWAGDVMLDSYEWERRRVHEWVIEESVSNYAALSDDFVRPGMEDDTAEGAAVRAQIAVDVLAQKQGEFHTIGMVLGYHYDGSPVVAGTGFLPPPQAENYEPVAVAGVLAPHFWVEEGVSLYDRFGTGFTLLVREGREVSAALVAVAAELGIPLDIYILPASAEALYPCAYTLVRPDQHVAWTGDDVNRDDARSLWMKVTGRK